MTNMSSGSNLTNFQKVIEFNTTFGIPVFYTPQRNIFTDNPALIKYRVSLIIEEINEFYEGIQKNSIIEIIDALADTLYVAYGMVCTIGGDADKFYLSLSNILCEYETNPVSKLSFSERINSDDYKSLVSKLGYERDILTGIINENLNIERELIYDYVILHLEKIIACSYMIGIYYDVNMNEAFNLVHESNMSKLCNTEEAAKETVQWYIDRPELGYLTPDYRVSQDGKYWVVYNRDTMKILKSIYYHPVDLSSVLNFPYE